MIVLIMFSFIALTGLRLMNIQPPSPEYDEIWTVQHYVPATAGHIFTDVATPNNHVLNSLGIKFFSSFIPNTVLSMRLPGLCFFLPEGMILHYILEFELGDNTFFCGEKINISPVL